MSYSSLFIAASKDASSSLDKMTSQFAHFPSRRKYPSSSSDSTFSTSSTSNSLIKIALLKSTEKQNSTIHSCRGSVTFSDVKNSSHSSSGLSKCNDSSSTVMSVCDSPSLASSGASEYNHTAFSSSRESTSMPPMLSNGNSLFAPAEALTILGSGSMETGSGAGIDFFPVLTKSVDSEDVTNSSSTRVENVEWHMLDKRKFYPMSTCCSFMIRGMLYPFTLVKTRIQIQEQKEMYKGTWDALRKIYTAEGVGGFYRGFWVNSFQVFSGIFYISTYEGVRHLMATRFDIHDLVLRAAVGGLCASVVGQMITVPFDIVSQHMMLLGGDQTKETKRLRIARHDAIHVPPEAMKTRFGAFQTIVSEIHQRHGIPGYYKGYLISICTYAPNSALWWGFYHWYTDVLAQLLPSFVPALMVQSCAAPAAGLSAVVATNPIDVVRARVQVEGSCTAREAAKRLWHEEGYRMFTKGLSARFIQSSFFSFFIILGYETVKRLSLKEEFKDSVPW